MNSIGSEPRDGRGYGGNNGLVLAAGNGELETVKYLLGVGADVTARYPPQIGKFNNGKAELAIPRDTWGLNNGYFIVASGGWSDHVQPKSIARTALQAASEGGYQEVVVALINAGADVNAPPATTVGRTALQAAAEGGHEGVVRILMKAGADVNAPPAVTSGRTAVQAAAGSGHQKILTLLMDSGASVNETLEGNLGRTALMAAAESGHHDAVALLLNAGARLSPSTIEGKMTELQVAAEGGHHEVVRLLIDSGVNVNEPPAGKFMWTALQKAAGGGHQDAVKVLIAAGADVNALPATAKGRTALQAAAEGGHEEVVKILMNASADVNAPPAEHTGRTALQAATCGGYLAIATILINGGADVNAPRARRQGITALEGAASRRDEALLELLISSHINVHERDDLGRTVLHETCLKWGQETLNLLLRFGAFDIDAKDYFGSTPLHMAVREHKMPMVQALIREGVNMNIKDNSGMTPSQLALERSNSQNAPKMEFIDILDLLLENGASTEGIRVEKLLHLLRERSVENAKDTVLFRETRGPIQRKSVKEVDRSSMMIFDLLREEWTTPSICFPASAFGIGTSGYTESFANPSNYLHFEFYPGYVEQPVVTWAWIIAATRFDDTRRTRPQFIMGIPSSQIISSSNPTEVILIAYVYLDVFVFDQQTETAPTEPDNTKITALQLKSRELAISWIMREQNGAHDKPTGSSLRSIHYRGTFSLKYLSIPSNGIEFCILFLDDVYETWLKLIEKTKTHLAQIRDAQLSSGGKDPKITECLLKDSQQWNKFRTSLKDHLSKFKNLLDTFKSRDVLYTELAHKSESEVLEAILKGEKDIMELEPIKQFSDKITIFKVECGNGITDLQQETKEMIDLEFSLVSIYEARRSIDLSAISNSMSMSMKRLSWITFIFLPLMFVSGLFGMNVNLLHADPNWLLYLAFALPVLTLVLLVWILFKYIGISDWVEKNIGSRLESALNKTSTIRTLNEAGLDSSEYQGSLSIQSTSRSPSQSVASRVFSSGRLPTVENLASWLRRRPQCPRGDEENLHMGYLGA